MAIDKIQSESINLADNFAFTGTVSGAGESNVPYLDVAVSSATYDISDNVYTTIAFNTVFEFAASTAPTFTSSDGKTDILVFKYNGAIWQEVGRTLNLSES